MENTSILEDILKLEETNDYLKDTTTWLYFFFFPLTQLILSCFIFLANLLVVLAFVSHEKLRTLPNYYVFNLAISDWVAGLNLLLCRSLHFIEGRFSDESTVIQCLAHFYTGGVAVMCSMFSILLVGVERYIKLFYALRYEEILTKKRVVISIVMVWVMVLVINIIVVAFHHYDPAFACNSSTVFSHIYSVYIFSSIFFPYVCVIAFIYGRIWWLTRQHRKKIRAADAAMGQDDQNNKYKDMQVALMMWYIVVILIVTYGMFLVYSIVGAFFGGNNLRFHHKVPAEAVAYTWYESIFTYCFIFSCIINPVVYQWKSKDFRFAFRKIFRMKGRKVDNESSMSGSSNATAATSISKSNAHPNA